MEKRSILKFHRLQTSPLSHKRQASALQKVHRVHFPRFHFGYLLGKTYFLIHWQRVSALPPWKPRLTSGPCFFSFQQMP